MLKIVLVTMVLLFSAASACALEQEITEDKTEQSRTTGDESGEQPADAETKQSRILDFIEKEKEKVENQSTRLVQWTDSFFTDQEYQSEVATTQFRLRPELYYRSEQGLKVKFKGSFRLRLPNLGRRVSLVGGSSDMDDSFDESVDDDINEPSIGLRFLGRDKGKWNFSASVGIKGNEFAGFVGPRLRYRTELTPRTSFRFVQKVLWQTNRTWQIRSRFDYNFALNERVFFRQMVDGRWRGEYSDEEGYRTRISSFLTRHLSNTAGLQGEFSTIFFTKPDTHVDEYVVALRYRKQTWRDWFYYEIVPQVSWENEFDYKTNPGIRLRIEIFFGSDKASEFWQREAEDSDDFRW